MTKAFLSVKIIKMKKHRFNKMPEMRQEDYAALLDSLKQFGYDSKFPIIFYEQDILDGWNRYRACEELGIEYADDFFVGTHEEAVEFVHRTNTRRNLTPNEQSELIGRYYQDIKTARGGDRKSEQFQKSKAHSEPLISTKQPDQSARKKAAEIYGVSEATVARDVKFVEALDTVPDSIKEQARKGTIAKADVIKIAKGEPLAKKKESRRFDKKEMKRLVGGIAFEVESLAASFPDTRTECDRILNLCRYAQEYTGV